MRNLVVDGAGGVVTVTVGGGTDAIAVVTACATQHQSMKVVLLQELEQVRQRLQQQELLERQNQLWNL